MRAAERRAPGSYLRNPRAICVYLSAGHDQAVQMDTQESVVQIISPYVSGRARGGRGGIAAKKATDTIPIVAALGDPVALGLIASEAQSGGNVTGITPYVKGLPAKQLELARELVPGAIGGTPLPRDVRKQIGGWGRRRRRHGLPRGAHRGVQKNGKGVPSGSPKNLKKGPPALAPHRRDDGPAPPGGRPGNPELRRKRFPKKSWERGPRAIVQKFEKGTRRLGASASRAGRFLAET